MDQLINEEAFYRTALAKLGLLSQGGQFETVTITVEVPQIQSLIAAQYWHVFLSCMYIKPFKVPISWREMSNGEGKSPFSLLSGNAEVGQPCYMKHIFGQSGRKPGGAVTT